MPRDFFTEIRRLGQQVEALRKRVSYNEGRFRQFDGIHPYQYFYVKATETIAAGEDGLCDAMYRTGGAGGADPVFEAHDAIQVKVFNHTEEQIEVDDEFHACRNIWGDWFKIEGGGGEDNAIIPVYLSQTGGTQGDGTNPATWTYDVWDAIAEGGTPPESSGDEILTGADPVSLPHHYARPNVGQVEPADFGLAWKKKKDPPPPEPEEGEDPEDPYEYELTWINEAIIGAICEEEEADPPTDPDPPEVP